MATSTDSAAPASAAPAPVFPIPVIAVSGSSTEMGDAHGRALGGVIRTLHERYFHAYFTSQAQRLLALATAMSFESRLLPEHLSEVRALAAQSGIDPRQMLLAQCFLDLTPMTACSTVTLPASASPDGVARFGRNLDFPSFNVADRQTVLLVFRPEGRNAFVSIGWPGVIGVLSGMNEHGLTLANMEVSRGLRLPSAMPYTLLYRTVLERCRTVDEAIALLESTPRQTANNLMLMDASGDRAVAEITPQKVTVRRANDGEALISTNHQRGDGKPDASGRCVRYDTLRRESARDFGRIDERGVESMLADVGQGRATLQSMVFEPENLILYLSTGRAAHRGTFHRIDLKPYLRHDALASAE